MTDSPLVSPPDLVALMQREMPHLALPDDAPNLFLSKWFGETPYQKAAPALVDAYGLMIVSRELLYRALNRMKEREPAELDWPPYVLESHERRVNGFPLMQMPFAQAEKGLEQSLAKAMKLESELDKTVPTPITPETVIQKQEITQNIDKAKFYAKRWSQGIRHYLSDPNLELTDEVRGLLEASQKVAEHLSSKNISIAQREIVTSR